MEGVSAATPITRCLDAFDIAVQKVELEMLVLLSGEHQELEFRSKGLKRRRDQMKSNALQNLETRIQCANELLAHEQQLIDEDYQASIDRTKEKLSSELTERIRVIEICRDGGKDNRVSTRSLRSKVKKGEDDNDQNDTADTTNAASGVANAAPSVAITSLAVPIGPLGNVRPRSVRRALSPSSIILDKQLDNDEIATDMYEINRDEQLHNSRVEASGSSLDVDSPPSRSKRPAPAVVDNNKQGTNDFVAVDLRTGEVKIGKEAYYKGQSVVVITNDSNKTQEISGIISSVNNSEVRGSLVANKYSTFFLYTVFA
jgi:hypothetical protein